MPAKSACWTLLPSLDMRGLLSLRPTRLIIFVSFLAAMQTCEWTERSRWTERTKSGVRQRVISKSLVTRPKYPPYRETLVAQPLSHCVFCGVADYRCCSAATPPLFPVKMAYCGPVSGLGGRVSPKKLASEADRAHRMK